MSTKHKYLYQHIITLILRARGYSEDEAYDYINEVQYAINDVVAGESENYDNVEAVIADYLQLPAEFKQAFDID